MIERFLRGESDAAEESKFLRWLKIREMNAVYVKVKSLARP
jgi:hypothetical protein